MDLDRALRILEAASGDSAQLRLASVDLLLAAGSAHDRASVRQVLSAASVPHWFDENILAALLPDVLPAAVQQYAALLRQLPLVEGFPARGVLLNGCWQDIR